MTNDRLVAFTHRFVPATAPGLPTLLLLHGTGGDENDLLPLGRALAPGAALLSPRGRVLEQGAPRFFRRLAEGVFDVEDLTRRAHELADFVGWAAGEYGFDPANVVAVGYSNGANIAAALLLLLPATLRAAVLLRAMLPFEPVTLPDLAGVAVQLAAGGADPLIAPDTAARLAELLRQAGAAVDVRWSAAGHGLTSAEVDAARDWLAALPPDAGAAVGGRGA